MCVLYTCEQVLFVHIFTIIPPRLTDPRNFITALLLGTGADDAFVLSAMLRLDNAPQAKVRTDCFSASL